MPAPSRTMQTEDAEGEMSPRFALRPVVFGDDVELLGMLTLPLGNVVGDRGVVICSPLAHQNITSYRPLRTLAARIAASGRPVLRFDWPGSGDSGDPTTPDFRWVDAIADAVEALRRLTGVDEVALVGLRVGAMLAAVAACGSVDVSELVLLAPVVSGRTYLRELRAFQALALDMFDEPALEPAPLPDGALETSGFLLDAADVAALGAIDLTADDLSALPVHRALIVTAQPELAATAFSERLGEQGVHVTVEHRPELAQVLEGTNDSVMPRSCADLVTNWLLAPEFGSRTTELPPSATLRPGEGPIHEQAVVVETLRGASVGVLCRPDAAPGAYDDWVVFLNAAAVRRVGPNRLWTSFARAWAAEGVCSFRFDVPGIGDSDGDTAADEMLTTGIGRYYESRFAADVREALDWLATHHGAQRFAVVGLCSGATWGYQLALEDERITAVGMVNPSALYWDENDTPLRVWKEQRRALRSPRGWRSLARRGSGAKDAARGALLVLRGRGNEAWHRSAIATGLRRLTTRGASVIVVLGEKDNGVGYFQYHLGHGFVDTLREMGVVVELIRGPDHTFRPLWSHGALRGLLEAHLGRAGYLASRGAFEGTQDPR